MSSTTERVKDDLLPKKDSREDARKATLLLKGGEGLAYDTRKVVEGNITYVRHRKRQRMNQEINVTPKKKEETRAEVLR
jgi:hypothetical protein